MFQESRKIQLIEDVLKVDSSAILSELETVLKKTKKKKKSFKDLVGVLTNKEADEMIRVIDETCEKINPEDWK